IMRRELFQRNSRPLNIKIDIDLSLKPGDSHLDVKVTIKNERNKPLNISIGQLVVMGDGAELFIPGAGFDQSKMKQVNTPILAAAGDGVSYGIVTDEGLRLYDMIEKMLFVGLGKAKAQAGSDAVFNFKLIVGDGDIASIYREKYRIDGAAGIGEIKGSCRTGKGSASDVAVNVLSPKGDYLGFSSVRADGRFSFPLPAGDYKLIAASPFRNSSEPISVSAPSGGAATVEMSIDEPAFLDYEITDDKGRLIPAAMSFSLIDDKPAATDGLSYFSRNKFKNTTFFMNAFTADGKGSIKVRPGKYDVYFSHGFEYEFAKKTISFSAGAKSSEKVVLKHSVDTTSWPAADLHTHNQQSHDTDVSIPDRLVGAAAADLDVIVATDHDRVTDFAPFLKELGLDGRMKTIVGCEFTTKRFGHFNSFPLLRKPNEANEGAPSWVAKKIPVFIEELRKTPGPRKIIQMNHPRAGSSGYLSAVGYDPATDKARDAENYTTDFDTMEILNSAEYEQMALQLKDWYGFLNRGKRITGVGNSDSHSGLEMDVGYPRNYVRMGTDDPAKIKESELINTIAAGRVVVSAGPFIRFSSGKAGPGDMVSAKKGSVDLDIDVLAPSWMTLDKLTVIANGEEALSLPLPNTGAPLRFSKTARFEPKKDTWYVVIAEGEKTMFPVYPMFKPIAITNPIFVDVDGNGKYDPPGRD
ncbi:MAG TPA: CehA/McbA family metallohydrolase, partial [bacterium]|nr:CehA/McbA family metallohydrolase [bacterium]